MNKMKKQKIIIWMPFFLGVTLLLVTIIDINQYQNNSVDVHTMLTREIFVLFIGISFSVLVLLSSIYWLIKKQWFLAIQAIISPILFFLCLIIGGVMGGAFLNAA